MGRKRGLMSDALKWELAKELGVDHIVATEGWGGVPSRQCGNLVRKAIELAEKSLAGQNPRQTY
ncbi:MAG: small, acid-soluble spore protein, alpha/beta type [Bacillota bacterium]|jgi:small acid-soluble spore protein F (minor alpha/beta-type SASP)